MVRLLAENPLLLLFLVAAIGYPLGQLLFVYTVGLANGASFVAALVRDGGSASTRWSFWCWS